MSESGAPATTKRVELEDGHWAEVRKGNTLADIRAVQLARLRDARGSDLVLDTIAEFPTRIVEWSRGPVTEAQILALSSEDAIALVTALREVIEAGQSDPNPSPPSSAGTRRRGETDKETSPGNGN